METEQKPEQPVSQHNPAQNELDFGANERITPKKVIQAAPSALDKLRSLFAKKEPQESVENKFSARKEPLFTPSNEPVNQNVQAANNIFSAATESAEKVEQKAESLFEQSTQQAEDIAERVENSVENAFETAENTVESAENNLHKIATETVETVENSAETLKTEIKEKAKLKNPETWAILGVLPQKHRRLFIALLALVLLLIFFFIMKPSSDTVQSFEQQNNNEVPIQFQSLDQSQPAEQNVLDAMNGQNQGTETAQTTENQVANTQTAPAANEAPAAQVEPAQPVQMEQPAQVEQPAAQPAAQQTAVARPQVDEAQKAAQEKARQERLAVERAKAEKAKADKLAADKAKAEKAKAEAKAKADKAAAEKAKAEKLMGISSEPKAASKAAPVSSASGSKTLTVPQGVSLMQVFRDNGLKGNLGDINAMTKAAGAGNALSSFKPGDKVQVSLNGGHVSELRLSNGARFVRQANGSYQFKK